MKTIALAVLRFYKTRVSPQLPSACRYTPTCSEYAMEAIDRHGVLRGGWLATRRVVSCNPFSRGGDDPGPGHRLGTRRCGKRRSCLPSLNSTPSPPLTCPPS